MSTTPVSFAKQAEPSGLSLDQLDLGLLRMVPEKILRKYQAFPLKMEGQRLVVAMADPTNLVAIDDLKIILELDIEPVGFNQDDIHWLMNTYFDSRSNEGYGERAGDFFNLDQEIQSVSIIDLVQQLLDQAIEFRASDIHIEPQELKARVRYRIDGILQEVRKLTATIYSSVVSRLKIMAELNIAEKRLPQDGRIRYARGGRSIDLRISTMPTVFGEKVVIRILDAGSIQKYTVEQLGFSRNNLARFQRCLNSSTGMVLITGPTGSGKTTTLYGVLNELNHEERNFSTIEDPVEYGVEGVNQTQVNGKAGMTFAVGLRALLRQDPDVIMVGEIRDLETAEIAIHASSTGHLVLSTLHTNDALGAIDRLMHIGIEPFQVASSVLGVVAQRLVRRLCPYCKEELKIEEGSAESAFLQGTPWEKGSFYQAKGCARCNSFGYQGRMALQEVLLVTSKLRALIAARATQEDIKRVALAEGLVPLKLDGLAKAQRGLTSIQEIMRVVSNEI